jgi:hypothetical protein
MANNPYSDDTENPFAVSIFTKMMSFKFKSTSYFNWILKPSQVDDPKIYFICDCLTVI